MKKIVLLLIIQTMLGASNASAQDKTPVASISVKEVIAGKRPYEEPIKYDPAIKSPVIVVDPQKRNGSRVNDSKIKVFNAKIPQELFESQKVDGKIEYDIEQYIEGLDGKDITIVIRIAEGKGYADTVVIQIPLASGTTNSAAVRLARAESVLADPKAPSLNLTGLLPDCPDCCCEDIVPCPVVDFDKHYHTDHEAPFDSCCKIGTSVHRPDIIIKGSELDPLRFRRNRIIYSVYPQYAYTYLRNGEIRTVKPLRVTAGQEATLELRNFNRDLYSASGIPTVETIHTTPGALFEQLMSPGEQVGVAAHGDSVTAQSNEHDVILLAASKSLEQISILLSQLRNSSCINLSNTYASVKQQAKARVDAYFSHFFNQGKPLNALSFLADKLSVQGADSELYVTYKKAYQALEDRQYRYVINLPTIPGNVDKVIYKIDVKPSKDGLPYLVPSQDLVVYTVGGFKVDFSSGFYYAGFKEPRYSIRKDSAIVPNSQGADSVINRRSILVDEGQREGEFGFSSFAHFYPKIFPGFNISGTIGAGLTFSEKTEKAAIRYFAGISGLIGTENRFIITYGLACGFVNRLSNQYQMTGGVFDPLPYASADVHYVRRFKTSSFISLTYNLPVNKKKEVQNVVASDANAEESEIVGDQSDEQSGAAEPEETNDSGDKSN